MSISKYTYDRRMAYVLGLKQYKDKRIIEIFNFIKENEEYMVMMSEAWLLQTIATIYPQEVFDLLATLKDEKLKLKTISKICDSFRFTDKQKEQFKSLRLK